ncbi:RNA polymerase sigma-70 factor (ECF subfamily) [Pedobacter sp. AK017]|uniref:RNA polymerase sigma factor n=1 Tax=Pedobacter sp. AK017 TaxID=2723073 RepID=UPI0016089077|nr:sigma-70 family RNA polymerase sigma factor [Pedobacter sp. AK017]MBB5440607.1 RNA polymerase sigma-70 factor (ECF subfamily) [Pedobacter sp. AK017]
MAARSTLTDLELTSLVKQNDKDAFDEIYARYWKKCYNDAYGKLRDAEVCQELVQDLFINLWTKRSEREIVNLSGYLSTAVRFQVFSLYRKNKKAPVFEEPLDHMAESYLQADSLFNLKELKGHIEEWLKMQPEKRREIFKMRFMDDLSTKEISEILKISQNTVQNHLLTATNSLKNSLGVTITACTILMLLKN